MEREFPEAEVTGHEALISSMVNQVKDRHVAAAALKAAAQVIVTSNLKDFGDLPEGIEAQSPDMFLCGLFDLDKGLFVKLLREQARVLRNPPMTFEELLERLRRAAPELVSLVHAFVILET